MATNLFQQPDELVNVQNTTFPGLVGLPSNQNIPRTLPISNQQSNIPRTLPISNQQSNIPRTLPISNQNIPRTLQISNQQSNIPRTLQTSNQNIPRTLQTSNQNIPRTLQTSNQNIPRTLQTSNQNIPRTLQTSNQNIPRTLQTSNQNNPRTLPISNQNNPRTLPISNQNNPRTLPISNQNNPITRKIVQPGTIIRPSRLQTVQQGNDAMQFPTYGEIKGVNNRNMTNSSDVGGIPKPTTNIRYTRGNAEKKSLDKIKQPSQRTTKRDIAVQKLNAIASGTGKVAITFEEWDLILEEQDPEINVTILTGLKTNRIDANTVLFRGIKRSRAAKDIIAVAFALRYNANPNIYISVNNVGKLHIINYTYLTLNNVADNDVLNAIIIMLWASGAKDILPAISDKSSGGVRYLESKELAGQISVQEWLISNNYRSILERLDDEYTNVDGPYLLQISTLLDRPDIVAIAENKINSGKNNINTEWPNISLQEISRLHSEKILEELANGKRGNNFYVDRYGDERWTLNGEYIQSNLQPLRYTIKYINYPAYVILLRSGYIPDYATVNDLIIEYRKYKVQRNGIAAIGILNMIAYSIKMGVRIDPYQYKMLEQTDESSANAIIELYKEPYWTKICRLGNLLKSGKEDDKITITLNNEYINGSVTIDDTRLLSDNEEYMVEEILKSAKIRPQDELNKMAIELNIPFNMEPVAICREMAKIYKLDPTQLKQAAIKRQMNRISDSAVTAEDYLKGTEKTAHLCRNRAIEKLAGKNPYEYNDIDLVTYQSEDGAMWCFVSDEFPTLISDRTNPLTRQPIPNEKIEEMKNKQLQRHKYGLPIPDTANPPMTYGHGVDMLRKQDTINNEDNIKVETAFKEIGILYGVTMDDVNKLSRSQAESILNDIDFATNNGKTEYGMIRLDDLDISHVRNTFIRISYDRMLDDHTLARRLFESIKVASQQTSLKINRNFDRINNTKNI